jgi:hypothetical protein
MMGPNRTLAEPSGHQGSNPTRTADGTAELTKRMVEKPQASEPRLPTSAAIVKAGPAPLLPGKEVEDLHSRWLETQ